MAFHVACPLTCRKVCDCTLGSSAALRKLGGKEAFMGNALALHKLMGKSPLMITTGRDTVEVLVPRLKDSKKRKKKASPATAGVEVDDTDPQGEAEGEAEGVEAEQAEPAEQYEEMEVPEAPLPEPEVVAEEHSSPTNVDEAMDEPPDEEAEPSTPPEEEEANLPPEQVFCGMCFQPENAGSTRHQRMLICEGCGRKFHRSCLKPWAENRDLFNWASWRCAHCRTCKDCESTGDPNRLLFCKRCDEAHHNNCKQMGAKVPVLGPYLCPKHSQCHSCGARVPGGGASSKWFHAHLFCDACGRLFTKNKYCPICLKVYRDTEPAPMVECDVCQHWVHCHCEGISDDQYREMQTTSDLKFTCSACQGEHFRATSLDDAITELWRRKDEADHDRIESARAAAGLPSESEMADLCPSSDDEQPTVAPKESKKFVIKFVKRNASEQKTPSGKKAGRPPKASSTDDLEAEAGDAHDISKQKKSSKQVARGRAPAAGSATKINLHISGRRLDKKEHTSTSEDTKEDEQQSEDGGQHSEIRRKRLPSSKLRDMAGSASNKRSRSNEDVETSKKKAKPSETPEPETEKKVFKVKLNRKPEVEASATRGQRSKRKRPTVSQEDEPPAEEVESDEDHTSILQRLGVDAVTKRVEVCRSSDKTWMKGTIIAVNQKRSQFTIQLDNGEKKIQKYGKEKVRLLGKK